MTITELEVDCPNCGTGAAVLQLCAHTNDEWLRCAQCGWGYTRSARRFGGELLAQLRALLARTVGQCRWSLVDGILRLLLIECSTHGRDEKDGIVQDMRRVLELPREKRGPAEATIVRDLAAYDAFYVMENGQVVYDYAEYDGAELDDADGRNTSGEADREAEITQA